MLLSFAAKGHDLLNYRFAVGFRLLLGLNRGCCGIVPASGQKGSSATARVDEPAAPEMRVQGGQPGIPCAPSAKIGLVMLSQSSGAAPSLPAPY